MQSEKKRLFQKEYRLKHLEELRAYSRQWKANHPGYMKEWTASHPGYHRDWRQAHPEACRNMHLKSNYGFGLAELVVRLETQNWLCLICGRKLVLEGRTNNRACVDHDHGSGEVRGILCNRCNGNLGWLANNESAIRGYICRNSKLPS